MRRAWFIALVIACGGSDAPEPPLCDPAACEGQGKLCDGDACVDPWRYGSPVFSRCENEPRATAESLAEKARVYDQRALALHAHPQMPWVVDVVLKPGVDPETATHADVAAWWSGENDGLFSGLVMAAEAYRYAVTKSPEARAALATLLAGERLRMDITGVPGLFTRQLIPPGVEGLACPTELAMYTPSPEKRGNKWVRIGDDGCAQIVDAGASAFRSTTHCGLQRFAGWCFLDNISQDEYVGHVFALGAIARLVDDAALRAEAIAMLRAVGEHLAAHDMVFVDWDGRQTQWGKLYPGAPGDTPGYLAILGMAFAATAATGTESAALASAYRGLQWDDYFDEIDQWTGADGCRANWNNLSMITVEDAVCQLRQFPRSNHVVARDTEVLAPEVCLDRQDNSLAGAPFAIADRCAATFAYWGNPYERHACDAWPELVKQPGGYLLPYWMGRYYGFIAADQ